MERARQSQSDQPHARTAAGRVSQPSVAATFVDIRPQAIAQRQLADAIHSSPYIAAQRTQIRSAFGAATRLQGGPEESGHPVIQRFVKVKDDKESHAPFWWAMQYEGKRGKKYEFARVRQAFITIDASPNEAMDFYDTAEALFDRVEELAEASKDRSVQPVWRESSPSKVMMELEYYFGELKDLPEMELIRTYQSNWDKNGGFGGEYRTVNERAENWVIHVHRGKNGGLKSAKVKSWATRGVGHNGSTLFKFENLAKIGVPTIDNTQID